MGTGGFCEFTCCDSGLLMGRRPSKELGVFVPDTVELDAIGVLFNVGFGFFAASMVMVSLANRFRDSAGIAFVLVVTILGRNDDIFSTWRGFTVNTRLT